ncbi:MAG: hypothetical protein KGS45_10725 [Planctomycetes bacterium]|nr:hypothetical protein [Planctomycetota bacterium]
MSVGIGTNGGGSGSTWPHAAASGGFQETSLQFGLWMQAQLQQAYWAGFQAGQASQPSLQPTAQPQSGGWGGWPATTWSPLVGGVANSSSQSAPVTSFNGPPNGPLAHLFGGAMESSRGGQRDVA